MIMRKKIIGILTLSLFSLASSVLAQELPMKVKGGHQLGETSEQFFAEGREKEVLSACAMGNFKIMNKSDKRQAKEYCAEMAGTREEAMSGKRTKYKSGDVSEMRTDTFTFDSGYLVKVELIFSAPKAEFNYRGHSFEEILAGAKQAYGPPTTESTEPTQDVYGVSYVAHRELWMAPHAAILITEQPGRDGSTTLVAFTRAEYDRTMAAPKAANPLE
jgi:hypothetical protein